MRWVAGIGVLLFAALALWNIYESRRKKIFFLGIDRVSVRASNIFNAFVFVVAIILSFIIFSAPGAQK